MAKARVSKKSTIIDMTPMVDLVFLLITFFMLTIKFKAPQAIEVAMPSSIATTPLDQKDVLTLTIGPEGRVFMGLTSQNERVALIQRIGSLNSVNKQFNAKQVKAFELMDFFAVDFQNLERYLDMSPDQRKEYHETASIAVGDSTERNELGTWVLNARLINPGLRIAIKADQDTPLPAVMEVINTLKKQKVKIFNLVTTQEADPRLATNEE